MAVAPTLKLPALLRPAHTIGNEFEQSTDAVFVPATPFSRPVCGRRWCYVLVWIKPNLGRLFLLKPINPYNG